MSRNKKANSRPLALALDLVLAALKTSGLSPKINGDSVVVKHQDFTTRIDSVPPTGQESSNFPIRVVLRVKTELPKKLSALFVQKPEVAAAMNAMATLGALTLDGDQIFVGSRLSIYEGAENLLSLHVGLIVCAALEATNSLVGAMRRTFSGACGKRGESKWSEEDMDDVREYLSPKSLCTTGGLGLTAEFSLEDGAVSAVVGDSQTALWQLAADQPHPEMGGGLFCILQMPHQIGNAKKLAQLIMQLNRMEWAPQDLAPHFGAWCPGRGCMNLAYVSFLPNSLHSIEGITTNVSLWAWYRARWANAVLASLEAPV